MAAVRSRWLAGLVVCAAMLNVVAMGAASSPREVEIYPGVWEIEFSSATLNASRKFCVAVPPSVARLENDWPVLFFLHGRGRTHRSLIDLETMRAAFLAAPFCTVFPQGDDGWYIDSRIRPADRYETYLEEVIHLAGGIRPLSLRASRRAITGWSMGGFGAVRYAIRHPNDFKVVAAIIGLLDFPRAADLPNGQNYHVPPDRFGTDAKLWPEWNPLHSAEALRDHAILIVTAADAFDRMMNEHFHRRLRELSIPHEYLVLPGAHTFPVVQAAVPRVIEFVSRHFAHDALRSSAGANP